MDAQFFFTWLTAGATALGAAFTALAAGAAWKAASVSSAANRQAKVTREDDELLAHAGKCLERSYEALMRNSDNGTPLPDRFNWLLCARLIEEYKATKERISSQIIRTRCEGDEDYWRYKIHERLEPIVMHIGYFKSREAHGGPVEPISATIVHAFADWPGGKTDPIDRYKDTTEAAQQLAASQRWVSLHYYLEEFTQPENGH